MLLLPLYWDQVSRNDSSECDHCCVPLLTVRVLPPPCVNRLLILNAYLSLYFIQLLLREPVLFATMEAKPSCSSKIVVSYLVLPD